VALTGEMLEPLCAQGFFEKREFELVAEATKAGRLPQYQALGAFYLIMERAARRAGKYKVFRAQLPSSFTYPTPSFYVAAPLPNELIHTIMQFADGRTLARFSNCSPQLRVRADKIATEGLARITTLRLRQPAVANWKTNTRLLGVLTNPPSLRSLLGPGTAWAPIRKQVYEGWDQEITNYAEPKTDYGREAHRAYMAKYALRLGDAAVIEGIMRTTDPEERYDHIRNFCNRLDTRERYLKNEMADPSWCNAPNILNHFVHVERVQAAAAAGKSIAEHSPLLQSAAEHDRYFPGLDNVEDANWVLYADWDEAIF